MPRIDDNPPGRTARRLEWPFLPPNLRAHRAAVREPGGRGRVAGSRLHARLRVRPDLRGRVAALREGGVGQGPADLRHSYREEARKLAALPESVASPRLLWHLDDDWVVLGLEYVDGRNPRRPWRQQDLDACLDATEQMAAGLTPRPRGSTWTPSRTSSAGWPRTGTTCGRPARPAPPGGGSGAGRRVRRGDRRRDARPHRHARRQLPDPARRQGVMCDWNWPVGRRRLGGHAVRPDRAARRRAGRRGGDRRPAATRDVPAEHIDRVLALLVGYFFRQRDEPVPPTSPYLRQHQRGRPRSAGRGSASGGAGSESVLGVFFFFFKKKMSTFWAPGGPAPCQACLKKGCPHANGTPARQTSPAREDAFEGSCDERGKGPPDGGLERRRLGKNLDG